VIKRAVWVVAIVLLPSCSEVPQQQLSLPEPLQGAMVEEGHVCDPSALARAIADKYPDIDPATARARSINLLYVSGCGGSPASAPPSSAPPSLATSASDLETCANLEAVAEDRAGYGISAPPEDEETLRRCRESQAEMIARKRELQPGDLSLRRDDLLQRGEVVG